MDTSALGAIVDDEADAALYQTALEREPALLSFGNRVEFSLVLGGRMREKAEPEIRLLLNAYRIDVVSGVDTRARFAADASTRFGKGRSTDGSIQNYGDLFAYALAKSRDLPLLF